MWLCIYLWSYLRLLQAAQLPPTDWDIRANMRSDQTQSLRSNHPVRRDQQRYGNEQTIRNHAQSHSKDCLDGVRQCEQQSGICRVDLEIFRQFCGDWLNGEFVFVRACVCVCVRAYLCDHEHFSFIRPSLVNHNCDQCEKLQHDKTKL